MAKTLSGRCLCRTFQSVSLTLITIGLLVPPLVAASVTSPDPRGVVDGAGTPHATTAGGSTATACSGGWTIRAPLPTGVSLAGVAWTGSTLVAVGNDGTIITSADEGASWTAQASQTVYDLAAVTSTGRDVVAVGERGTILTSSDGRAWIAQTSPTRENLLAVTWTSSQLVAVGDHGAIVTSQDGSLWNVRSSGTSAPLLGVTWTGQQLVAVGGTASTGIILTSQDGVSWTSRASHAQAFLNAITWTGASLVAVGGGATSAVIVTSPDGSTWTPRTPPTSAHLAGVVAAGAQLVAAGSSGTVLVSSDGASWTARPTGTPLRLAALAWTGTRFVAVGDSGAVLTSSDAAAWTWGGAPALAVLRAVVWTGSQIVAVGYGGAIVTSPDGVTWSRRISPVSVQLNAIAWTGKRLVAVGDAGVVVTSTDAATWHQEDSATSAALMAVCWTGTQLVAMDGNGGAHTSTEGTSWTEHSTPFPGGRFSAVVWTGELFAAIMDNGCLTRSSDGVTWEAAYYPAEDVELVALTWTGTELVGVGAGAGNGGVLTSQDGITWTVRSTGDSTETTWLYAVTWTGTELVAVGAAPSAPFARIVTSPDGVVWTAHDGAPARNLYGVTTAGTQVVAVGAYGAILTSACPSAGTVAASTQQVAGRRHRTQDAGLSTPAPAPFVPCERGVRIGCVPRQSQPAAFDDPRAAHDLTADAVDHDPPLIPLAVAASPGAETSRWRANFEAVSASFTPPPQNYVLHFMGGQAAVAPLVPALALGNEFTIEAWVYLETPVPWATIIARSDDLAITDFGRWTGLILDGEGRATFVQSPGQPGVFVGVSAGTPLPLRTWTHLAGTLKAATLSLFVNGTLAATGASQGPPPPATAPFEIGERRNPDGSPQWRCGFVGALREVRLWSRALSGEELQSQATTHLTGDKPGLAACWPLDDGAGRTARDVSPNHAALDLPVPVPWTPYDQPVWWLIGSDGPYFIVERVDLPQVWLDQEPPFGPPIVQWYPIDLDSDGSTDILTGSIDWERFRPMRLLALHNNGHGSFSDARSNVLGDLAMVGPGSSAVTDFNGDGRDDLVIADQGPDVAPGHGDQSRLLIQSPDGRLVDATASHLPTINGFAHTVAVGDMNSDGAPDIYLGNICCGPAPPELLVNDGSGRFTLHDETLPAELQTASGLLGFVAYTAAHLLDLNNDGQTELVVGVGGMALRDRILLNDGAGNLSFASNDALPPRPWGGNCVTVQIVSSDFDGDGRPDLLMVETTISYTEPYLQLLLNNRDGTFRDASQMIPQNWPSRSDGRANWIQWVTPTDFNGDGWIDFVAVGWAGMHLFLNDHGQRFVNVSAILPMGLTNAIGRPITLSPGENPSLVFLGWDAGPYYYIARNIRPFVLPRPIRRHLTRLP